MGTYTSDSMVNFTVMPEHKAVGPQSVDESKCYTQLYVSVNIPTVFPISVMYFITNGSAKCYLEGRVITDPGLGLR